MLPRELSTARGCELRDDTLLSREHAENEMAAPFSAYAAPPGSAVLEDLLPEMMLPEKVVRRKAAVALARARTPAPMFPSSLKLLIVPSVEAGGDQWLMCPTFAAWEQMGM
jgi:hypothetical protein